MYWVIFCWPTSPSFWRRSSDGSTTDETTGTTGGAVCGDGVVEPGETCDDGSGVGCDTYHDGGDGVCVPPGTCSSGHVLSGDDCVPELAVAHVHIHVSKQDNITLRINNILIPHHS